MRISHFARESYSEPTSRDCNGNFEQGLSPKRKKTDSIDGMDANGIRSTLVSCAYSHLRVTRTNLGAISDETPGCCITGDITGQVDAPREKIPISDANHVNHVLNNLRNGSSTSRNELKPA